MSASPAHHVKTTWPLSMKRVAISSIVVADRFRHDMGDLPALARSIEAEGLLQPIGITEENRLVFGERRLAACRDILGWTEIDVRVVKVSSIIAGEFAENEMRKDFTPSERVAIAEAVRREIAGRHGGSRNEGGEQAGQRSALKGDGRDIAAKQVGFGSGKQLERAEKVVQLGVPQVVAKVDAGKLPISKAANIVQLPAAEQIAAVAESSDTDAKDEALRSLRHEIEMHVLRSGPNAYTEYVTKHDARPDPATAATIGKLLGCQVRASDGTMQPPKSRAERSVERAARQESKEKQSVAGECHRATVAVVNLGANNLEPELVARSIDRWQSPSVGDNLERAVEWLNRFAEEWRRGAQNNAE